MAALLEFQKRKKRKKKKEDAFIEVCCVSRIEKGSKMLLLRLCTHVIIAVLLIRVLEVEEVAVSEVITHVIIAVLLTEF